MSLLAYTYPLTMTTGILTVGNEARAHRGSLPYQLVRGGSSGRQREGRTEKKAIVLWALMIRRPYSQTGTHRSALDTEGGR
jgi:hypothetical protein